MHALTRRIAHLVILASLVSPLSTLCRAADPAASRPADAPDPDARRLTFIGDQLSADEAAIAAINKALLLAGYQAVVAAHHADDASRGNELMDRNGGAPVPWKDFYGRTAKDFIMHDKGSPVYHQIARPSQLNYVYRANDNQIANAKAEVSAMGKKVDLLLARRRQLETEQSSLWATLAFESITNRDISLRGLYRDQLKAGPQKDNSSRPDSARTAALASAVLYLRTVDRAVTVLSDKLESDQFAVYTSLRDTLAHAQDALRESAAVFADTPGVDPAEAHQMMDVVNQTKRIQSLCKDACEAWKKAQDADAAQEEGRKLLYRRTLQDSLFDCSEETAALDTALARLSETWDIRPQQGVRNPDPPLDLASRTALKDAPPPSPNAAGVRNTRKSSASIPDTAATPLPPQPPAPGNNEVASARDSITNLFGTAPQLAVDAEGAISVSREEEFPLLGTEGRAFTLTGELFMESHPPATPTPSRWVKGSGGFIVDVRCTDRLHGYGISGKSISSKRALVEGKLLEGVGPPVPLDQPDHTWLPFRFEVSTQGLSATVGDTNAVLQGPLNTHGSNALSLAPGAKVRHLHLELKDDK